MAADYSEAEAAFAAGYAAEDERQRYFWHGYGVPIGIDPPLGSSGQMPAGLGYSRPPMADPVFVAEAPSLVPQVLPVPLAFDAQAPAAVTGSSHGWSTLAGSRPAGESVVYAGVPSAPRRSLWQWLTGR